MRRNLNSVSMNPSSRQSFRENEEVDLELLQDLAIVGRDFYHLILKTQNEMETPYGCNALDELVDYALSDFMAALLDTVRTGDRFVGPFERKPSSFMPDFD